jgi:iron complex transport system substrate-binding protein
MRLASLAPGATEVLYALGCGEDIVCVTEHCDYPYEAREKVNVWGAAGLK